MNSSAAIIVEKDIASVVSALRADGVATVGPCLNKQQEKVEDTVHTMPNPSIRFQGGMETLLKAMGLAQDVGLAVLNVGMYYSAGGGLMLGPWWEMTFRAHV